MDVNLNRAVLRLVDELAKDEECIRDTTQLVHSCDDRTKELHKVDLEMYKDSWERKMELLRTIK
jgi:hypothetical protein